MGPWGGGWMDGWMVCCPASLRVTLRNEKQGMGTADHMISLDYLLNDVALETLKKPLEASEMPLEASEMPLEALETPLEA